MRNLTLPLENYTVNDEFELLEVSRRRQYLNGEPTETFDTVYKVLISYEPIEVRIADEGSPVSAEKVLAYTQAGQPLKVSFEGGMISISPKSQYELSVRGTASKINFSAMSKGAKAAQA